MGNPSDKPAVAEPLAKPNRSLVDHTLDVVAAFRAMFGTEDAPEELTRRWLAFFKLPDASLGPFLRDALLACLVHDWGKANSGFSGMLTRKARQTVRHEVVSVLIMTQPKVWEWLGAARGVDLPLVLAAVAGHHLKAGEPGDYGDARQFGAPQSSPYADFTLTWAHPRVRATLESLADEFGIEGPLPGGVPVVWSFEAARPGAASYRDERERACGLIDRLAEELAGDTASERARRLRAVRSALIAADSAGSGLFRTHEESGAPGDARDRIRRWVASCFDPDKALDETRVRAAVIDPRVAEVAAGGGAFAWNEFQEACADPARVPARALLLAPCGSGKTLAAWRWVAARCRERPVARAVFLYPTRGTATEGFHDYVAHAGPELAALVHGTADLDLDRIDPESHDDRAAAARLFALRQWPKRVFSATADQFLAFLQHDYGSTCLLPLLADAAVVLDEVHSYDRGMFTALLQFLEHFDVPVLAMTATMLERRKADLERHHLTVVDGLGFGTGGSALREAADHRRYKVTTVAGAEEAERIVGDALGQGLRVLWVVNTVDRAQQRALAMADAPRADHLATRGGVPLLCYHSRFRLRDRHDRHAAVVRAFKRSGGQPGGAVLGVTTQVCELSLDLDCDVLVSEWAPVTALIQRFGRCCRDQSAHQTGRPPGRVILYEPETRHPYEKDEMRGVEAFVAGLAGSVVSQIELEGQLAAAGGASYLRKNARFISDGPWACQGQDHFRDAEDLTRQAVLPCDWDEYQALDRPPARWRAQELLLPIPRGAADGSDRPYQMPAWLSFADVKRHKYLKSLGYVPWAGGGFRLA